MQGDAVLGADGARDVALAGSVLDKIDVAGVEADFAAVDQLDFADAAEGDDVLAAGSRVPVDDGAGGGAVQLGGSGNLHHFIYVGLRELGFDLFGVGLAVGAGEQVRHHDGLAGLGLDHSGPGVEFRECREQGQRA